MFVSPAPGTVPRRADTPYVLSERKADVARKTGTLE